MSTNLTVLVAGSTGMLGSKIVSALLKKGNIDVRAMVRSSNDSNAENRQKIEAMKAKGAAIVEGDLMQPETLLPLCKGVDVVVSAVGNNEVTVPGQKHLIDAAKQQGVKRFIPSDYSVDYRKLDYGDNDNLDKRKEVFVAGDDESAIIDFLSGYWSTFGSLTHDRRNIYGTDSAFVLEALNEYTRQDGKAVTVTAVAFTDRDQAGQVTSVRFYTDTTPVFASTTAE